MELIFLGTGGSIPTEDRGLPCLLLNYMNEYFLFDCGEGSQRQMRIAKVNFMRISKVFLTHLHADHYLGLAGLLHSMEFMGRKKPLSIYGPKGTERVIECMLGMAGLRVESFEVEVEELLGDGTFLEVEKYEVSCIHTKHLKHSLAFCFEEKPKRKFLKERALALGVPEGPLYSKLQRGQSVEVNGRIIRPDDVLSEPIPGRKVVYTGDTGYFEELVAFARGADVLVHDATFLEADARSEEEGAPHSTAKDAARVARDAGVKKLYLVHVSQRYKDAKALEEEARSIFPNSWVAEDFTRVKVERRW